LTKQREEDLDMMLFPYFTNDESKISLVFDFMEPTPAELTNMVLIRDYSKCLENV
jgi:hypothetical protein